MSNYKKIFKRIFAVLIAVALAVPMFTTGLAKADGDELIDGEVKTFEGASDDNHFNQVLKVHKLLMKNGKLDSLENLAKDQKSKDKILKGGYLLNGINLSDYGNTGDIQEIAGVKFELYHAAKSDEQLQPGDDSLATGDLVTGVVTKADGATFELKDLPAGQYILKENRAESTYIGEDNKVLTGMKAVPQRITLPIRDGAGVAGERQLPSGNYAYKPVNLYPKNTEGKPTLDKKIGENETLVSKQIGDEVKYKITVTIPENSTLKVVALTDKLTEGLTLDPNLNANAKITSTGGWELPESTLQSQIEAGLITVDTKDNGFVVSLDEKGLEAVNKKSASTITIEYSAIVNDKAFADTPQENNAALNYGNRPGFTSKPGDGTPVPQNPDKTGKLEVTKQTDDKDEIPEGLTIKFTLKEYDPSVKDNQNAWVEPKGDIEKVKELTSASKIDGKFKVVFEGLNPKKTYKVIETLPDGYVPNYKVTASGKLLINNKKNDNPPVIITPPVTVKTGGYKFMKIDEASAKKQDKVALPGAKFYVVKHKGENEEYLAVKDGKYVWVKLPNGAKGEAEVEGAKIKIVESAAKVNDKGFKEGQFEIYGLSYNEPDGTLYSLKEYEAPSGYMIGADPYIDFTVTGSSYTETSLEDKGNKPVPNKAMTIPVTGGIGSAIFVVAGVALMGLAVYTINKKRKTN